MPTLSPRSRRPSARLTAVVDLPTPPLPEATAMMAPTPGMPVGACGARAPGCGRAGAGCAWVWDWVCGRLGGAARTCARRTFAGQSDQCRRHAGNRAYGLLGAGADRLPLRHGGGVDSDREEHLAVGDEDVGQRAGFGQRLAVGPRNLTECRADIFLGDCHGDLHTLVAPMVKLTDPRASAGIEPSGPGFDV